MTKSEVVKKIVQHNYLELLNGIDNVDDQIIVLREYKKRVESRINNDTNENYESDEKIKKLAHIYKIKEFYIFKMSSSERVEFFKYKDIKDELDYFSRIAFSMATGYYNSKTTAEDLEGKKIYIHENLEKLESSFEKANLLNYYRYCYSEIETNLEYASGKSDIMSLQLRRYIDK